MFGMKTVPFSGRSPRASRPASAVALALWVLFSLLGNGTPVLCLDAGGECSPAAATTAPCHDQAPDADLAPSCGSCVDIAVPDESLAHASRPDRDLRAPAAAPSLVTANDPSSAAEHAVAAAAPRGDEARLHPAFRTTVLLI